MIRDIERDGMQVLLTVRHDLAWVEYTP